MRARSYGCQTIPGGDGKAPEGGGGLVEREFFAGELAVGLEVAFTGAHDYFGGEFGGGGGFVPGLGFEVVADELFVEGGLVVAGFVVVGGPEAAGVGGEDFVDQDQAAVGELAELELGVGDDDAVRG